MDDSKLLTAFPPSGETWLMNKADHDGRFYHQRVAYFGMVEWETRQGRHIRTVRAFSADGDELDNVSYVSFTRACDATPPGQAYCDGHDTEEAAAMAFKVTS